MRRDDIVAKGNHLRLVPPMAMKELTLSPGEEFVLPVAEWIAMYTVPTAAKKLGVDRQRVYQLIESDTLEAARLLDEEGDLIKVVVSKRSVDGYIAYRKKRAAVARPSYA